MSRDQRGICPKFYRIGRDNLTLDYRAGIVEGAEEVRVGKQAAEDTLVIAYI
jgi:hypothetical protein